MQGPRGKHACHEDGGEAPFALVTQPLLELQQRRQHVEGCLLQIIDAQLWQGPSILQACMRGSTLVSDGSCLPPHTSIKVHQNHQ